MTLSASDSSDSNSGDSLLVDARGLSRYYKVGGGLFSAPATVKALQQVSFCLRAGSTLAVVGESGCGKSTLARVITMIEPPSDGELYLRGHRVSSDMSLSREKQVALRASVQIVFQDPFGSLNPRQTIGRILEEPLLINVPTMSADDREHKARDMLNMTGLRQEHYDRYPHMFSGGQRQRIAVARALMLQPQILVLDEPVSALDLSIQSQILNLLVELQDRLNLAYLFISHDLSVVKHMADEIMVMYLGRVVESGPAKKVFDMPQHPYTQALLSATPVADPTRTQSRIRLQGELPSPLAPPAGCAFNPRCWKRQDKCAAKAPATEVTADHAVACYFPESGVGNA